MLCAATTCWCAARLQYSRLEYKLVQSLPADLTLRQHTSSASGYLTQLHSSISRHGTCRLYCDGATVTSGGARCSSLQGAFHMHTAPCRPMISTRFDACSSSTRRSANSTRTLRGTWRPCTRSPRGWPRRRPRQSHRPRRSPSRTLWRAGRLPPRAGGTRRPTWSGTGRRRGQVLRECVCPQHVLPSN